MVKVDLSKEEVERISPVTVSLRDIPLTEFARFLTALTKLDVVYEQDGKTLRIGPLERDWHVLTAIVHDSKRQSDCADISRLVLLGPIKSDSTLIDRRLRISDMHSILLKSIGVCIQFDDGLENLIKSGEFEGSLFSARTNFVPVEVVILRQMVQAIQVSARSKGSVETNTQLALRAVMSERSTFCTNSVLLLTPALQQDLFTWADRLFTVASLLKTQSVSRSNKVHEVDAMNASLSRLLEDSGIRSAPADVEIDRILGVILFRLNRHDSERFRIQFGITDEY
jgi:hypothetical protein